MTAEVEAPQYARVETREKWEGSLDKGVLMLSISESLTGDREFNEFVLATVSAAPNDADLQAEAWFRFVSKLQYRREAGEVYRNWKDTVKHGGDCDDLTILVVAGLLSLGLQAFPEILTDRDGWGFHVRARAGFPPHAPTHWAILDPVSKSERAWAMANKDVTASPLLSGSASESQPPALSQLQPEPTTTSTSNWWPMALIGAAGFALGRLFR